MYQALIESIINYGIWEGAYDMTLNAFKKKDTK